MIDLEKVISGLECIKGDAFLCEDCGYSINGYGTYDCKARCAADAIVLLKEQHKLINEITQRRANNGAFD